MADATTPGVSAPHPERCAFYVERKKRFCKMQVGSGRRFCGEHAHAEKESKKRRISCPLDPKHTVFEDLLEKHLKKCNSREKPRPVYYVQDINAGPACDEGSSRCEVPLTDRSKTELDLLLKKLRSAVKGLKLEHQDSILSHPSLIEALNDPNNGDFACKHLKQQASLLGNMEALNLLGPNQCFVEFGAGKGKLSHWIHVALKANDNIHFLLVERSSSRFKVDGKHQSTDAKFQRLQVDIQHLDLSKVPILGENGLPVVGMGKHLCGAATDLALRCLLERSGKTHHGMDDQPPRKKKKILPLPIEDLEPDDRALNGEVKVSGIAIALFKSFIYLALRCLLERSGKTHHGMDDQPPSNGVKKKKILPLPIEDLEPDDRALNGEVKVSGIAIALCCHHRCDWRHYVGKEFFRERGLGASEFDAFQRMSSWATCGMRKAKESPMQPCQSDHTTEKSTKGEDGNILQEILSIEDREHIGSLCKLLINQGRVHFLEQKGYTSSLRYYTSKDVSLENVLLTALPTFPQ
ncbi:tRNA:m(4)X modification enzyme TRM13 homolog [Hypomesus transpacificus]|uniref:tRNA:m(4)X modification enzyme TRM13 homolog n=1 Tax=Hypomesus transpacificus TaxID=137520 RepID=UPI001F08473B|nr:tRNA:m(4)X modification enzyme TRM13 homolog [Hypomesus transpacificus]